MPKIRVELIRNQGTNVKRYRYEGNKIIIRPWDKQRNAGYQPTFTHNSVLRKEINLIPGIPFLKIKQERIMLFDGADRCIDFYETPKTKEEEATAQAILNRWDRSAMEKLFEANVLKDSGNTKKEMIIPFYIVMILGIVVALSALTFMVVSGRLRI